MAIAKAEASPGFTHLSAISTACPSGIDPAFAGQVSPSSSAQGRKCLGTEEWPAALTSRWEE
jgi:hypothetical protein